MSANSEKASTIIEKKKNSQSEAQKDSLTKALDKLNLNVTSHVNKLISDNKGLFFPNLFWL
ncbi:MAG: hypothetical protein HC905_30825 [Bacteroidales bacterium]|nr:hypothetical protein [Bacteroidales bacterium]